MSDNQKRSADAAIDTIAAIITPPGEGGIAAIRVAGPKNGPVLAKHLKSSDNSKVELTPFMLRLCNFVESDGRVVDEVTAVYMPHGKSYTGLDQIELFCHGGRQVVQLILDAILNSGARAAEPGEFTRLAFENGRIDLAKAEAVAEVIAANTQHSYEAARAHLLGAYSEKIDNLRSRLIGLLAEIEASIDYPEEEITPDALGVLLDAADSLLAELKELLDSYRGGKIVREGFKIAIAGRPNSGKSSLFNLLLRQERALVTPTAGTTRDYLTEAIDLDGYIVHLTDTAGLRKSGGMIEKAGQATAQKIIKEADLVLWMHDLSKRGSYKDAQSDASEYKTSSILFVGNKSDLSKNSVGQNPQRGFDIADLHISCKTKKGLQDLKKQIVSSIEKNLPDLTSGVVVTSTRHAQKLREAIKNIKLARKKIEISESPEMTAFDLRAAASSIDEITGRIYNDDILDRIFAKFCIGK